MTEILVRLKILPIVTASILLTACSSHDIKDSVVSDRVKACSAGFSDETQAKLHASLEKQSASGTIDGNIKQETKSLIFAETPIEDHVKVYEDYLKCVEANWNVVNTVKKVK
jgi:hypothetical protein